LFAQNSGTRPAGSLHDFGKDVHLFVVVGMKRFAWLSFCRASIKGGKNIGLIF
jgi:hypothetical protein